MKGIEILATEKIATEYTFSCEWFFITIGVFLGIGLLASVFINLIIGEDWAFSLIIGIIVGLFVGVVAGFDTASKATPVAYTNQYKVTISDEVLMNEFNEKYEIIDQEGKIYTIRERE